MTTLDYTQTRRFWENRYRRADITGELFVANLTDNIPLLGFYKDKIEKLFILKKVCLDKTMDVLDLGCGSGRMAIFFARYSKSVTAVDFSDALLKIAAKQIKQAQLSNVNLICAQAQDYFQSQTKFDIVFLGGILSFLNEADALIVLNNIKKMSKPTAKIIIRDSLVYRKRVVLNAKHNSKLGDNYSVIYRSLAEFKFLFSSCGLLLKAQEPLSCFPFLGLYHRLICCLFKKGRLFSYWSEYYLRLFFSSYTFFSRYHKTGLYRFFANIINKYEQILFIFSIE